MHETVQPLQWGLNVAGTLGIGAMFAAGNLFGRRLRRPPVSRIVTDNEQARRFEISVGGELAGFTEYERRDGVVTFNHTEIDPRFRGRGLAGALIGSALDASRDAGFVVEPNCPFVRAHMEKHEQYADLFAKDHHREPEGCCALPS